MKKNRVFSLKFKADAVQRMQAGESPSALSRTLKVRRKLLYEWRDRVLAGQPLRSAGRPRKALRQNRPPTIRWPGGRNWNNWWDNSPWKTVFSKVPCGESRNCASRTTSLARWRLRADPSDDATARRHGNPQLVWIGPGLAGQLLPSLGADCAAGSRRGVA